MQLAAHCGASMLVKRVGGPPAYASQCAEDNLGRAGLQELVNMVFCQVNHAGVDCGDILYVLFCFFLLRSRELLL